MLFLQSREERKRENKVLFLQAQNDKHHNNYDGV
jgi:hypothetical protein